MKKPNLILTIILIALWGSSTLATDSEYLWWYEPCPWLEVEPEPVDYSQVMREGQMRAIVLVSKLQEDTATWLPWDFYESLIIPDSSYVDSLENENWKWSVSSFLYKASGGKLIVTGDVNPGCNHHYVTAPQTSDYYKALPFNLQYNVTERLDVYERDILEVIDTNPNVDFKDYDANEDGYIDFIFYVHPYNVCSGFWSDTSSPPVIGDNGYAAGWIDRAWAFETQDTFRQNTLMKACRHHRLGSAMAYYYSDPDSQFTDFDVRNLMVHELGHSFGPSISNNFKNSFGNINPALPDRYDQGGGVYDALSGGIGKYSVMQMWYYAKHSQLYSPWERYALGWIEPTVIDTNSQNMVLRDFNVYGDCYLIPVDSIFIDSVGRRTGDPPQYDMNLREYFLVVNYQPDDNWLNDLGWAWLDEMDSANGEPHMDAHGVLIWHINERFWDDYNQLSELAKFEDLECAAGLMNLTGDGASPFGTEAGWDHIDRWYPPAGRNWNENLRNARSCSWNDFYNPDYYTAFHALTNPSSDGYNCDLRSYTGNTINGYTYDYSGVDEILVLQNLPTHVGIEGIHYDGGTDMKLCIRRSRIWTDLEMAMDRTTQRKFVYDGEDYHFIYPLRNHIYYTTTYEPSEIWYKAEMVGPNPVMYDSIGCGIWPAIVLDENKDPYAILYDTTSGEVLYGYREEITQTVWRSAAAIDTIFDTAWIVPCTLGLASNPGPVSMDYFSSSGGGTGGWGDYPTPGLDIVSLININMQTPSSKISPVRSTESGSIMSSSMSPSITPVPIAESKGIPLCGQKATDGSIHLAYINETSTQYELHYTFFPKLSPEDASANDRILDSTLVSDSTRMVGASLVVDDSGYVHIAYGGVKDDTAACYYRCSQDWDSVYRYPTSISLESGEPLVPYIDRLQNYLRVVYNANGNIFASCKLTTQSYDAWMNLPVPGDTGCRYYPQIAGSEICWTQEETDTAVYRYDFMDTSLVEIGADYPENSFFCHATRVDTGAVYLYQQGVFYGPKWAVYYCDANGFGGNQESDFPPIALKIIEPKFTFEVSRNFLTRNHFSVFTTGGACELAVFDVSGRRIDNISIEEGVNGAEVETVIDCNKWPHGVYFVRAVHDRNNVYTEKVVRIR